MPSPEDRLSASADGLTPDDRASVDRVLGKLRAAELRDGLADTPEAQQLRDEVDRVLDDTRRMFSDRPTSERRAEASSILEAASRMSGGSPQRRVTTYDPWFAKVADRYGQGYARRAGFFDEAKPWGVSYADTFPLPEGRYVLQFSGAFHPFHDGHLQVLRDVIASLDADPEDVFVVIHADHLDYRASKGEFEETVYRRAFQKVDTLGVDWMLVREDAMPNGCSRNFTRLYSELQARNREVWFVAGGDRANYALAFRDDGHCVVAGRDKADLYGKYRYLAKTTLRIVFIGGSHPLSSSEIRGQI